MICWMGARQKKSAEKLQNESEFVRLDWIGSRMNNVAWLQDDLESAALLVEEIN